MSALPSATANERLREILQGDRDRHEDRHASPARPRRETPSSGLGRWPFEIQQEGKAFFSEEKKQKTFGQAVAEVPATRVQRKKSFLVLFSKKNRLLRLSPVRAQKVGITSN